MSKVFYSAYDNGAGNVGSLRRSASMRSRTDCLYAGTRATKQRSSGMRVAAMYLFVVAVAIGGTTHLSHASFNEQAIPDSPIENGDTFFSSVREAASILGRGMQYAANSAKLNVYLGSGEAQSSLYSTLAETKLSEWPSEYRMRRHRLNLRYRISVVDEYRISYEGFVKERDSLLEELNQLDRNDDVLELSERIRIAQGNVDNAHAELFEAIVDFNQAISDLPIGERPKILQSELALLK